MFNFLYICHGLTLCLVRLHNFCIERRGGKVLTPLASDAMEVLAHGGFAIEGHCPEELLGAGDHNDDTTAAFRRNFGRNPILNAANANNALPRDKLLKVIEDGAYKRPCPKRWEKLASDNAPLEL